MIYWKILPLPRFYKIMGRGRIPPIIKLCEQEFFQISAFQSFFLCIAERG